MMIFIMLLVLNELRYSALVYMRVASNCERCLLSKLKFWGESWLDGKVSNASNNQ